MEGERERENTEIEKRERTVVGRSVAVEASIMGYNERAHACVTSHKMKMYFMQMKCVSFGKEMRVFFLLIFIVPSPAAGRWMRCVRQKRQTFGIGEKT